MYNLASYNFVELFWSPGVSKNETGTSKVGAIYKAQKAQDFFLKKNLKILIFFFQKMSHSAENVKGGPFGLY